MLIVRRNETVRFACDWWLRRNLSEVWLLLHFGDVLSRNQGGAAGTDFNQENSNDRTRTIRALRSCPDAVSQRLRQGQEREHHSVSGRSINGTTLPAGDYTVKYDVEGSNAQVKFMKGSKEVASANGQLKTLTKRPDSSQVVLDNSGNTRTISEIDFGGKDTAISFASGGTTAGK